MRTPPSKPEINHPFARAHALLTVDLAAIAANYRLLREKSGAAQTAAVVKADAYGLGARHVVPALHAAGCRWFFVATPDEALDLRAHFPAGPAASQVHVAVLGGILPGVEADYAQARLVPVLNTTDDIARWRAQAARSGEKLQAILHVDTGMNRLGLSESEMQALEQVGALDGIDLRYVMSHLAMAENTAGDMNERQRRKFLSALARMAQAPASLANSSGIFLGEKFHFQLTRPGCALYGVNPLPHQDNPMRAVVTLQARILQVRKAWPHETVGYGATHLVRKPATLLTLGLGYADGYLRALSARGHVMVRGVKCPVVGRVSMDAISIDASGLPEGQEPFRQGELVEILGQGQTVDDVAADAGTIGYEILTSLGKRYLRQYKEEEAPLAGAL